MTIGAEARASFVMAADASPSAAESRPQGLALAATRLAALGYSNVAVRVGDGYAGSPQGAPWNRILLTAAPPEIPIELASELAVGGVLVAPIGESDTSAWCALRRPRTAASAKT